MKATIPTRSVTDTDIWNAADVAVRDSFRRRCQFVGEPFYLYWRPARAGERMSLPIIERPFVADRELEGWTRDLEISGAWPNDVAIRKVAERMRQLPILEGSPPSE